MENTTKQKPTNQNNHYISEETLKITEEKWKARENKDETEEKRLHEKKERGN